MLTTKLKAAYIISYITIIVFTLYGIMQVGDKGGPCNAGIAIIEIFPIYFFSSITQLIIFLKTIGTAGKSTTSPIAQIAAGTFAFIYLLLAMMFTQDDKRTILYLLPFILLNGFTFYIVHKKQQPETLEEPSKSP